MDQLFTVMELLGTVAFALSGAMVAIDRGADLFGVVFLGMTTAVGGGILRDCILGQTPPAVFSNPAVLVTALACPLAVFAAARWAGESYRRKKAGVDTVNNLVDALGLGAFTVTGIRTGLAAGCEEQWFLLLFLGMTTAIGGGLLRDVMTGAVPFVFTKRVYALASLTGGCLYLLLRHWGTGRGACGFGAVALVFAVRLMATLFHWNLPRIQPEQKQPVS